MPTIAAQTDACLTSDVRKDFDFRWDAKHGCHYRWDGHSWIVPFSPPAFFWQDSYASVAA